MKNTLHYCIAFKTCAICRKVDEVSVFRAAESPGQWDVGCFNCGELIDGYEDTITEAIKSWNRSQLYD